MTAKTIDLHKVKQPEAVMSLKMLLLIGGYLTSMINHQLRE